MKAIKFLIALAFAGSLFAACDTEIENKEIQKPLTYDDLYYQNLRDYKKSDHAIAFMWFAQYGAQNSMAVRFAGLPDSLDICSLWGGIPDSSATEVWKELRFEQQVKGTKMLVVAITRIDAESKELDFKKEQFKGLDMPAGAERDSVLNHAIDMYADYFLDQVFTNDLDGFDADYEPEGDWLSGDRFLRFYQRLALFLGPNPDQTKQERLKLVKERYGDSMTLDDCNKLLCVDSNGQVTNNADLVPLSDYYFVQSYGGGTAGGNTYGAWPISKVVLCENVGDNWSGALIGMKNQAAWEPPTGHKGGFGAFFGHRNYNVTEYNPEPYAIFRQCIQVQNPAVH